MATKKKYRGGLKVSLLLLFITLLSTFSTCYASFSDPFTQTEVDQINEYYNINITLSHFNQAYNLLKTSYPSIDKRNVLILRKPVSQNETNGLYLFANNGTFGTISYVYVYAGTSYYNFKYADSSEEILTSYFDYVWTSTRNSFIAQTGNTTLLYVSKNDSFYNTPPTLEDNLLDMKALLTTMPTQSFYYKNPQTELVIPVMSKNYIILDDYIPPEPELPSGDSSGDIPTNPSGENGGTGYIDYTNQLNNIDNSINTQGYNIVNTLSGESQAIRETISGETDRIINFFSGDVDMSNTVITSEDITNSLGFQIASDPYDNFWITLTNNLKTALLGSKRSIDITFRGSTWTISLDEYLVLPVWLTIILTPISTCLLVWVLVRQWKLIFDKISSGNVDSLLKDNSEEGISNLF